MEKMSESKNTTCKSPTAERVCASPKLRRFKKSKTPPHAKRFSPSSSDDSSGDDFPSYRSNWREKSPKTPLDKKAKLERLDDLLKRGRRLLADLMEGT